MVLKEAYRYQNHLTQLISDAEDYLMRQDFITKTSQEHNRRKVNPDAENETIEVKNCNVEFTPSGLVDFIVAAINEKQKLSDAIVKVKKATEIDIDSAIAMNKVRQNYISVLNYMSNSVKANERETTGKDYKFDANMEQKPYYYTISEKTEINYDRNNVRKLAKKLQKESDEISTKLDIVQLTSEVDFKPTWELSDTLEDVVVS